MNIAKALNNERWAFELYRRQARWEPWKALAAIAAAAVFAGGVLTIASWWQPAPQTINVRIEGTLPR